MRRTTLIETGLFEIQGRILQQRLQNSANELKKGQLGMLYRILREPTAPVPDDAATAPACEPAPSIAPSSTVPPAIDEKPRRRPDAAAVYLRLCHINPSALKRLGRYETALWRQAAQTMLMLDATKNKYLRLPVLNENTANRIS